VRETARQSIHEHESAAHAAGGDTAKFDG